MSFKSQKIRLEVAFAGDCRSATSLSINVFECFNVVKGKRWENDNVDAKRFARSRQNTLEWTKLDCNTHKGEFPCPILDSFLCPSFVVPCGFFITNMKT